MGAIITVCYFMRVTLTEIEDENEWDWPNPGNVEEDSFDEEEEEEEEGITTDELFNEYDALVQDWKRKVEVIIGDSLKQIRKNGRDKRMLVKYIPGESTNARKELYTGARAAIAQDLNEELVRALSSTQRKLNKLTLAKQADTADLVAKVPQPKQLIVNKAQKKKQPSLDLKALLKDMDSLYGRYAEKEMSKVPVYNLNVEKTRSSMFGWWKPICTLFNMLDYPAKKAITFDNNESNILNVLKDFTMQQKARKTLVDEWDRSSAKRTMATKLKKNLKTGRRGTSNHAQRMLERRERRKFALKEFEDKGEKHYLVVRKQLVENNKDAEDIFEDWRANLAQTQAKKPRKRKITHRAQRKEIIKEAVSAPIVGPCTYAQALRKNLKRIEAPAVEDVFESFAEYVESLSLPPVAAPLPATARTEDDMIYIFHAWRHNLSVPKPRMEDVDILASTTCIPSLANFSCGQPTVLSTPKTSRKSNPKSPVTTKKAAQLVKSFKAPKPVVMDLKKNNIEPKLQELIKQTHQESTKEAVPKENTTKVEKTATEMVSLKENIPATPKRIQKDKMEEATQTIPKDQPLKEKKFIKKDNPKEFVPSAHAKRQIAPELNLDVFLEPVKVQKSFLEGKMLPVTTKKSTVEAKKSPVESRKEQVNEAVEEVKKAVAPPPPQEQKALPTPVEVKQIFPTRKSPKAIRKVKPDYTRESFFSEWMHNLEQPRSSLVVSTPKVERKPKAVEKMVDEEVMFEDDKDSRRQDFAKVARIKDKKRAQAERKSINKRIK